MLVQQLHRERELLARDRAWGAPHVRVRVRVRVRVSTIVLPEARSLAPLVRTARRRLVRVTHTNSTVQRLRGVRVSMGSCCRRRPIR